MMNFRWVVGTVLGLVSAACAAQTTTAEAEQPGPDMVEVDAGTVALPDSRPANTPDAGHPDALPAHGEASAEASAPVQPDAGAALPDGARSDGGGVDSAPVLGPDASPRDRAIAEIEATYPQLCGMFDGPYCGGVVEDGIILTYPLFCMGASSRTARDGHWTLGGGECNHGCSTPGQLCTP